MNSEIEYSMTVATDEVYKIYESAIYESARKRSPRRSVELAAAMKVVIDTIEKFAQECDK